MFSAYLCNEEIPKFRVLIPHPRKAIPPSIAAAGLKELYGHHGGGNEVRSLA